MRNRLIALLLAACLCADIHAADFVTALAGKVAASRVSFDYCGYMEEKGVRTAFTGRIVLQDSSWFLKGNGMEIWCDGVSRWTVDEGAKEVVVEPVSQDDAASVPVSIISRLPELFTWEPDGIPSPYSGTLASGKEFHDSNAVSYTIYPKPDVECSFSSVIMYFDRSGALIGVMMDYVTGQTIGFTFSSLEFSEPSDMSSMALSEGSFDSSYVITDLR